MFLKLKLKNWERRRVWYIDPVKGNDKCSGVTPNKALKTFREYLDRTASDGFREYTHRVDIFILNDLPPDDPLHIHGVTTKSGLLYIHGARRVLDSGVLSQATGTDVKARSQATITDSERASWEIGSLIYFPDKNAYATVIANMGNGVARISDPTTVADPLGDFPQWSPEVVELDAGDEYKVIRQTKVTHSGLIDISSSADGGKSAFGFSLIIEDLEISRLNNDHMWSRLLLSGHYNAFYRVKFHGATLMILGWPLIYQCCIKGSEHACVGMILQLIGSAFIDTSLSLYGVRNKIGGCVFQKSSVRKHSDSGTVEAWRTGFFDVDTGRAVINMGGGVMKVYGDGIYGDGNTVPGVILQAGSMLKVRRKSSLELDGKPELRIGGSDPKFDYATPPLENYSGRDLPLQSPCSSWTELAAEPFGGEAANYSKNAYVIKDE